MLWLGVEHFLGSQHRAALGRWFQAVNGTRLSARPVKCETAQHFETTGEGMPSMKQALMVSVLFMTLVLGGCDSKPVAEGPPLPPVTVARAIEKTITEWDEYTGRFTAVETVEVRARVSGFIESIHFKEGQVVKQGDLLFVIDPRPYTFALEQAKADVERAKAKLEIASLDVQRATPLVRSQAVTGARIRYRRATERDAAAQVASLEAASKQAQLNLEWTQVRAPITGRISDKRVDAGNLITGGQTGATLLTVIVSIDPIHFVFDGSEADFLRYVRLSAAGARPLSRDVQNPVAVRLADEADYKHQGRMNFVDNVLNPRTGTIRGRAVFDNQDGLLTPGYFGDFVCSAARTRRYWCLIAPSLRISRAGSSSLSLRTGRSV
jgi:RND family efflux transporter MFP subunit